MLALVEYRRSSRVPAQLALGPQERRNGRGRDDRGGRRGNHDRRRNVRYPAHPFDRLPLDHEQVVVVAPVAERMGDPRRHAQHFLHGLHRADAQLLRLLLNRIRKQKFPSGLVAHGMATPDRVPLAES